MDRKTLLTVGRAAAAAAAAAPVSAHGNPLPSFDDVVSFIDGGVVIESRRYSLTPPPPFLHLLETTGHGAWKRTGNRTFEVFFRFLLQETASDGPIGTDNIKLRLTLTGDTLAGSFHSDVRDLNDDVVDSFDGTYSAERITV